MSTNTAKFTFGKPELFWKDIKSQTVDDLNYYIELNKLDPNNEDGKNDYHTTCLQKIIILKPGHKLADYLIKNKGPGHLPGAGTGYNLSFCDIIPEDHPYYNTDYTHLINYCMNRLLKRIKSYEAE